QLADRLAGSPQQQAALALLLHAGSQVPSLDDAERAHFAELFRRQAIAMRGPHIDEDPAAYDAYIAQMRHIGREPTSSNFRTIRRHLARCDTCRARIGLLFSRRVAERIERRIEQDEQALAEGTQQQGAPYREVAHPLERIVTHNWRAIARSARAASTLTLGTYVTDHQTFSITIHGVAEGELTLLAWGPDAHHGGRHRA